MACETNRDGYNENYSMKEKCIRCGKLTPYDISYPVILRCYYIEGSGQLCEECWRDLYVRELPALSRISANSRDKE